MRGLITSVLAAVPFDARGRRAIDETLLDWAHEEALARGPWHQTWVSARAVAGVLRTVASATALEVVHIPYSWLLGRLLLVGTPLFLLLAWRPLSDYAARAELGAARPQLLALLIPQAIPIVLPIALFWALSYPPRDRRVPVVGLAAISLVVALLLLGWGVPAANQRFRVMVFSILTKTDLPTAAAELRRGRSELTLPELTTQAIADLGGRAFQQVVAYTGLALLAPALVVLASAVATVAPRRRRHWMWMVPVAGIFTEPLVGYGSFIVFAGLCMIAARHLQKKPQPSPTFAI